MRISQVSLVSLLFLTSLGAAAAEEGPRFLCKSGDSERVIEVVYTNPDQSLPCEVRYHKDGTEETLWRARDEEGFCEQPGQGFAADQQERGWECGEAQETGAATGDTQQQELGTLLTWAGLPART